MPARVQPTDDPVVTIVPRPDRGARYRFEFPSAEEPLACGHRTPRALLWLVFLEAGRETGREVTETICSECDPARFSRAQAWADALP